MPYNSTLAQHVGAAPRADERTSDALFPQRFTPFEYYYYLEHRPNYPSVFPVRVECRGPLDRQHFERAFEQTHRRHPFLSARIELDRRKWPLWVAGQPAPIDWSDEADSCDAKRVAPREPHGLRLLVRREHDKIVLVFLFPHVAVDGLGAFQFLADLMVAYDHACSGEAGDPPWRPLERGLLDERDGHTMLNRHVKPMDFVRAARMSFSLLLRRAAVVSDRDVRPSPASDPGSPNDFLVHTLSERETAELSRVAGKLSVRLHDLLMRDYYLMLADWNRDTSESRRPIRVLIPINVRRKQDYRMPAANVFSYAFLARRADDCRERALLLDWIRAEMANIKRTGQGLLYEMGLRLLCLWPPLLRFNLNRRWAFATAVFSNLNAGFDHVPLPWRDGRRAAGQLILENGYGVGPIRPQTRVCCAVHTYAGRMSICFRCDRLHFDPKQQQALLDAYLARLRETIACES
jgi:hypothetical protein